MEHSSKGEKIALAITITIIVFAILYILYIVFLSNKHLKDNTVNNITNSIENNINPNNNPNDNHVNIYNDTQNIKNNITNETTNSVSKTPQEIELTSFTTSIYDKDAGRIHNISLANSKLNNTIIKQGEEFSFIATVGTMGEDEGYQKALGFDSEGRKIQIAGGGICQLSSTLYNAALNIGLEITERHAHSRRVYYVPKDKDATVFYPSLDLKFINNTENDIKITVSNDEDNVTVKLYKVVPAK